MRLRLEATPQELEEKSGDLLKALAEIIGPVSPDMADALAKALPRKEPALKFPVLRALQKQTEAAYAKMTRAMLEDIGKILDQSVVKSEDVEKALYIGPRGGRWADAAHTIPYDEKKHGKAKALFPNKSVGGKTRQVTVPGLGKVWAEPHDGDDTFPPAIKFYKVVDGWLTYEGHDGSRGVVIGTKAELTKWMQDVDKFAKTAPKKTETRDWTPKDGGSGLIAQAKSAAKKVADAFGLGDHPLKFKIGAGGGGEHSSDEAVVMNAHKKSTREFMGLLEGISYSGGSHTAAHEMAHKAYTVNPEAGKKAAEAVKAYREKHGPLTLYHSISGSDFEGLMEAAALFVNAPEKFKKNAPELYAAIDEWFQTGKITKAMDHTKAIAAHDDVAYRRVKQVLIGKGYVIEDFDKGGPLYGWSTNQLIDLARDKRAG